MIESIGTEDLHEQHVALVRGRAKPEEIGGFVGQAYGEVMAALSGQGLAPVGPPVVRYSGMDEAGQAMEFGVAAGFPCPPALQATGRVEVETLPAGKAVVAVHVGQWQELGEAYGAVESYLGEHGLARTGDPWETYLDGPEAATHRTVLTQPCGIAG